MAEFFLDDDDLNDLDPSQFIAVSENLDSLPDLPIDYLNHLKTNDALFDMTFPVFDLSNPPLSTQPVSTNFLSSDIDVGRSSPTLMSSGEPPLAIPDHVTRAASDSFQLPPPSNTLEHSTIPSNSFLALENLSNLSAVSASLTNASGAPSRQISSQFPERSTSLSMSNQWQNDLTRESSLSMQTLRNAFQSNGYSQYDEYSSEANGNIRSAVDEGTYGYSGHFHDGRESNYPYLLHGQAHSQAQTVVLPSIIAASIGRTGRIPISVAYPNGVSLYPPNTPTVGVYDYNFRLKRLSLWDAHRQKRIFYKKVKYTQRRMLANGRQRVKGRFVKDVSN